MRFSLVSTSSMDDQDLYHAPAPDEGSGGSTAALFLALFLLVLAFFILLVSISTFENIKSQAVMDSLTSTFATVLPPSSDPTAFSAKDGDVLARQEFQNQISDIFSTVMPVAKVEIVQPGKKMRVTFPIDSMFVHDSANLRPVTFALLDRIVVALSGSPAGLHFESEFVVGAKYLEGNALPIKQTLALSQAGNFAREMESRGAPPNTFAVGVGPGNPSRATVWFYVRSEPYRSSESLPVQIETPISGESANQTLKE